MRTFRVLGAFLVLVLVASVVRSADAKVKEPPPELRGPGGARLPSRPEITETTSIDYAALPLAAEAPVKRWTEAAIRVDEWPPSPRVQGEKAGPSWTVSVVPYTCFARVGDYLLPSGRQFSEYHGKLENASGSEAEWFVVDDGTTTDHTMEIRRFMGTFEKHLAMTSTEETVGATALVPAEVYAFRRCERGCDKSLGDANRVEELSVVAMHPLWASVSARTALELDSDHENRPFSVVTAEVRPGSSATVVIDVTSAPRVPAYRRPPATIAVETYQVDVVWPKDGPIETTLFAGSLTGTWRSVSGRYEDD